MKTRDLKYYAEDEMNCHCFFQPAFVNVPKQKLDETNQIYSDHSPLNRHRILKPRLVPPGIK